MSETQKLVVKKLQEYTGHRAAVYALTWDKNLGLLSGGGDGWLVNWTARSANEPFIEKGEGKLLAKIEGRLFAIATFNNGLLAGTMKGDLIYLQQQVSANSRKWAAPRLIKAHDKGIFSIIVLEDSFLTAGGDGFVCKWDFDGNQLLRKKIAPNSIRSINLHPHQQLMALATSASHIYFLDANNLEQVTPPYQKAHNPSVFSTVWTDAGHQIISGGRDALLKLWPYPDFEPQARVIKAHLYTINSIAKHPSKNLLATASRDRTIKIWDKTTFALLKVIDVVKYAGHTASVNTLLWNEAGLFSAGDDKKIMQWEIDLSTSHTDKTDS